MTRHSLRTIIFPACLLLTLSLFGCRSQISETVLALSEIEAELRESEDDYQKAIAEEPSPDNPEGLTKQIAQVEALFAKHQKMYERMHNLLKNPFPAKEKPQFDEINRQLDERNSHLRDKVKDLREAVDKLEESKTEPHLPKKADHTFSNEPAPGLGVLTCPLF